MLKNFNETGNMDEAVAAAKEMRAPNKWVMEQNHYVPFISWYTSCLLASLLITKVGYCNFLRSTPHLSPQ